MAHSCTNRCSGPLRACPSPFWGWGLSSLQEKPMLCPQDHEALPTPRPSWPPHRSRRTMRGGGAAASPVPRPPPVPRRRSGLPSPHLAAAILSPASTIWRAAAPGAAPTPAWRHRGAGRLARARAALLASALARTLPRCRREVLRAGCPGGSPDTGDRLTCHLDPW
jgi:hypothetical protein